MAYPTHIPQCVLITGATGDFGKAFAQRFAEAGSKLVLHGRNPDKLAALAKTFDAPVHTVCFDLKNTDDIAQALSNLPEDFSGIDCLINNAGGALGLAPAQDSLLEDWDNMVAMNVSGLLHVTRAILPGMVKRKSGHVINIGSIAGNWPYPGGNVYCATKAFVQQFSLCLRADLQGTNIRSTNIEPGMVETQFSLARFKGDVDKAASVYANTKPLLAEDIAESVFWCATLPPHVNINTLELMPTVQSFGPLPVEKNG